MVQPGNESGPTLFVFRKLKACHRSHDSAENSSFGFCATVVPYLNQAKRTKFWKCRWLVHHCQRSSLAAGNLIGFKTEAFLSEMPLSFLWNYPWSRRYLWLGIIELTIILNAATLTTVTNSFHTDVIISCCCFPLILAILAASEFFFELINQLNLYSFRN